MNAKVSTQSIMQTFRKIGFKLNKLIGVFLKPWTTMFKSERLKTDFKFPNNFYVFFRSYIRLFI